MGGRATDPAVGPERHIEGTSPRHNLQAVDRIRRFLEGESRVHQRAKIVALRTGFSYNYVRKILPLGDKEGWWKRYPDGYGLPGAPAAADVELRCENLVIVSKGHIANPRGAAHVSPTLRRREDFGGRIQADHWFAGFLVHLQEFDNGTLEVQLGVDGQPGLSYTQFVEFVGWLQGVYPTVPKTAWFVKSWEWGKDLLGFKLRPDGPQSITLQLFQNLWLKLYQKTDSLKVEVRHKTEIGLEDALEITAGVIREIVRRGTVEVQVTDVREGT